MEAMVKHTLANSKGVTQTAYLVLLMPKVLNGGSLGRSDFTAYRLILLPLLTRL